MPTAPTRRREARTAERGRYDGAGASLLLEDTRLERARHPRVEFQRLALVVEFEPDGLDYSTCLADRHRAVGLGALLFRNDVQIIGREREGPRSVAPLRRGGIVGIAVGLHVSAEVRVLAVA